MKKKVIKLDNNKNLHISLNYLALPGFMGVTFIFDINDIIDYQNSKSILCWLSSFCTNESELTVFVYYNNTVNENGKFTDEWRKQFKGKDEIFDFLFSMTIEKE